MSKRPGADPDSPFAAACLRAESSSRGDHSVVVILADDRQIYVGRDHPRRIEERIRAAAGSDLAADTSADADDPGIFVVLGRTARDDRCTTQTMTDSDIAPKKPSDSLTVFTELMMPNQVNNLGHVFGGELLSMVDRAAAVAAMRHAGRPCVTVSIDRVDFKLPIYTGELVTCSARVNFVGRTSMEIGVWVDAENLISGTKRHTNTCLLTFVAIDDEHRPCSVQPLDLSDPEDERRFRDGKRRREVRVALDKELEEDDVI